MRLWATSIGLLCLCGLLGCSSTDSGATEKGNESAAEERNQTEPAADEEPARQDENKEEEPAKVAGRELVVSVDAEGKLQFQDKAVTESELVRLLAEAREEGTASAVVLKVDRNVGYARVAEVMNIISGAGYKEINLQ